MKNKLRLIAAGALLAAGLPTGAYAQVTSPQTATLNVSATVASICQLSAPGNIAFGTIQAGTPANAAGSVTVTCNRGATISATTTSANASGSQKRMLSGVSEYLDYQVWQPNLASLGGCATTQTDWTAPLAMTTLWSASGGPRIIPVCATTAPSNTNAAGTYNDTLTISVTFS